jgi:hypothetical protein
MDRRLKAIKVIASLVVTPVMNMTGSTFRGRFTLENKAEENMDEIH